MNTDLPADISLCHKCKILIVDDDNSTRLLLRKFLEPDGHTILEAANGQQGLDTFTQSSPDLILTDIIMPVMDGISFVQALRKRNQTIPVIVMTGDIHGRAKEFFDISSQLGASYSLEKPISKEKLDDALSKAIEDINNN